MKAKIEQGGRAEILEAAVAQDGLDAIEVGGKPGELFLVGGCIGTLDLLHTHKFDGVDIGLVLDVPIMEGGFWNVKFVRDMPEAPAVGAEDYEAAHELLLVRMRVGR